MSYNLVVSKGFRSGMFNLFPNQMKIFIQCFFICFPRFCANLYCVYSCSSFRNIRTIRNFSFSLYLIFTQITFVEWYQRRIQDTWINAKSSEEENMTIPIIKFLLHESCVGFNTSMKTFAFLYVSMKGCNKHSMLIIINTTNLGNLSVEELQQWKHPSKFGSFFFNFKSSLGNTFNS